MLRLVVFVLGVVIVAALGVLVVVAGRIPNVPSTEECVDLWNAGHNAAIRAEVAARGYPTVRIEGVFSEDRYEGCVASFLGAPTERWALFGATRIPFEDDRPLRWRLEIRGSRWESEFPHEPFPTLNATVHADGRVSLSSEASGG